MTLSILWFILIAVLWTMYLVLEGFDYGVGMLQGFLARDDRERTQALRTIGPHWDGNEVWLLTAGGATFAAFPEWYATMFSGMYLALFLILLALIVRVCAVEWRSKIKSEKWRSVWDRTHAVSALLVPLLFGVAFANLVQGMKIEVVTHGTNAVVAPADVPASLATSSPVDSSLSSPPTPSLVESYWLPCAWHTVHNSWHSRPKATCASEQIHLRLPLRLRPPLWQQSG